MGAGVKHSTTVSNGTKGEPADWNAEHDYDASLTTDPFKFVWKDTTNQPLSLANQTSGTGWTDLDLSSWLPDGAKIVYLKLSFIVDTVGAGTTCSLKVRKNGTLPLSVPQVIVNKDEGTVGGLYATDIFVGMDSDQIIEYHVEVGTGWQLDVAIDLLAYME